MKSITAYVILFSLFIILLSCCIFDRSTDHPCNLTSDQELEFRELRSFAIIDKNSSINLVDSTAEAIIHRDSVVVLDDSMRVVPISSRFSFDNFIFEDLDFYYDIPINDTEVLLNLTERIFYLRTSYGDIDTITVHFRQCVMKKVLFNGLETSIPPNFTYNGRSSFYFKK